MTELSKQRDSRIIALGDFQESSESSHIKKLKELGYKEVAADFPTVRNDFFNEKNIDHILFSTEAWDKFKPTGISLDGDLIDDISDHCLLAIMSAQKTQMNNKIYDYYGGALWLYEQCIK